MVHRMAHTARLSIATATYFTGQVSKKLSGAKFWRETLINVAKYPKKLCVSCEKHIGGSMGAGMLGLCLAV